QHLNQSAREAIAENLTLEPIMGKRLNVMDEAHLRRVSKGSAREGQTDQQQAARGASALIDNARWCGFVAKMT
ncbi:helicase RepA family protein, partial [Aeromonas caviae]|uniref:helicase RepA family protein n=1 Tax=Aeromonas caviae TaxID=648 RepID=UPI001CC42476